jgi:hypothetical protein
VPHKIVPQLSRLCPAVASVPTQTACTYHVGLPSGLPVRCLCLAQPACAHPAPVGHPCPSHVAPTPCPTCVAPMPQLPCVRSAQQSRTLTALSASQLLCPHPAQTTCLSCRAAAMAACVPPAPHPHCQAHTSATPSVHLALLCPTLATSPPLPLASLFVSQPLRPGLNCHVCVLHNTPMPWPDHTYLWCRAPGHGCPHLTCAVCPPLGPCFGHVVCVPAIVPVP